HPGEHAELLGAAATGTTTATMATVGGHPGPLPHAFRLRRWSAPEWRGPTPLPAALRRLRHLLGLRGLSRQQRSLRGLGPANRRLRGHASRRTRLRLWALPR